jgi:hypothetical protein
MPAKNGTLIFTIIAFATSWLFWVPDALMAQNVWNAPAGLRDFLAGPFNRAAWGPLLVAVLSTYFY